MSQLAQLLELIHDAHTHLSTLYAEYRDWTRPRPTRELVVKRSELGSQRARWRGVGPFPPTIVSTRRVWLHQPNSIRVEIHLGNKLTWLGVLNSTQWWDWDPREGARTMKAPVEAPGSWTIPPLLTPPLLDPVRLLVPFRFGFAGYASHTGRKAVCARAWPRKPAPTSPRLAHEFQFDAEHGTMLHHSRFEDGHLVAVNEALEVRYDAHIDPERFVFAAPDGKAAHPVGPQREMSAAPSGPEDLEPDLDRDSARAAASAVSTPLGMSRAASRQ